jgi:hypothetical protein
MNVRLRRLGSKRLASFGYLDYTTKGVPVALWNMDADKFQPIEDWLVWISSRDGKYEHDLAIEDETKLFFELEDGTMMPMDMCS